MSVRRYNTASWLAAPMQQAIASKTDEPASRGRRRLRTLRMTSSAWLPSTPPNANDANQSHSPGCVTRPEPTEQARPHAVR